MQRQHSGRPGTLVLPGNSAGGAAATVAKTLTSSCSIRRPGTTSGTLNATTGKKTGAAPHAAHYTGACRADPLSAAAGERMAMVADEEVPEVTYLVTLEQGHAPQVAVDDIVDVAGIGELSVTWVEQGSLTFSQVLYCTENQA
jgi:hypothetical protein